MAVVRGFQLFSMVALTVELVNGGTKLQSTGQVYYTWDIRAYLFVLGLVFLLIYYKRYCSCIERSSEEREVVRNCLSIPTFPLLKRWKQSASRNLFSL